MKCPICDRKTGFIKVETSVNVCVLCHTMIFWNKKAIEKYLKRIKAKSKDLNTCKLQDFMGKPVKAEKNPHPQCVVEPLDGQVSKKDGVSK